jgi:enamine deaminase RidA (YjgF/YER057c/UK114 family)
MLKKVIFTSVKFTIHFLRYALCFYYSIQDAPKPIGPYILDVRNQTQQVFRNIQVVLHATGANMTQTTRCLVLLADMNDFQSANQIYASFFSSIEDYLARSRFAAKTLPANGKVEIECTAYTKVE